MAGLYLANVCFTFRGGFDMRATRDGGQSEVAYREYGQFDPWYRWEERTGDNIGGFSREFDLLSWSALAGLLSLVAFYGMIRLGVSGNNSANPGSGAPGDSLVSAQSSAAGFGNQQRRSSKGTQINADTKGSTQMERKGVEH